MGYRSDVAIAMYAIEDKDAPAIKLWIKENFPFPDWDDECAKVKWFDRGLVFTVTSVKWYDSYEDVTRMHDAIETFEELFTSDDKDAPYGAYEFIRIGEDDDDVEQRRTSDAEWIIGLNRSIYSEV